MDAKEIIKILIQADIIEQESDIETTYTQKREWIAKEILAKSKEECHWKYDETHCYYDTDCGEAYCLIDGTLKENGHLHCPYCGRKIAAFGKEEQP